MRVGRKPRPEAMDREDGFTLIELMAVMALTAVLVTLGAFALRNFWLVRSHVGERDKVFTQLRAGQQQATSESSPFVVGAWFEVRTPETDNGTPQWGMFRYRPADASVIPNIPESCTSTSQVRMAGGVQIQSVDFSNTLPGSDPAAVTLRCKGDIPAAANATDVVLFLPRGTATGGCVTLTQPLLDRDDVAVRVTPITGRVTRLTETEAADQCP